MSHEEIRKVKVSAFCLQQRYLRTGFGRGRVAARLAWDSVNRRRFVGGHAS